MTTFEKVELCFIIIEFLSILIEIGLQIYEIASSKKMEKNIISRIDKMEGSNE